MALPILSMLPVLGDAFKGILDLVDGLVTTEEEKASAKLELMTLQAGLMGSVLDHEKSMAQIQTQVIIAEAQGSSWLQRNWRPIIMLDFGFLLFWNWMLAPLFGLPVAIFPDWVGTLLTVGIGGYVLGRTGEKMMTTWSAGGQQPVIGTAEPTLPPPTGGGRISFRMVPEGDQDA